MSALADARSPSIAQRPMFARWTDAWSRLNRRHALGLALAILLMTAVDLSTMADKLDQPGVVKVIVFDLFVSVSLFSITLLAWSAAVAGRPPGGPERMRAVVIAIVASGVLVGRHRGPDHERHRDPGDLARTDGQEAAGAAAVDRHPRQHGPSCAVRGALRARRRGAAAAIGHQRRDPRRPARAGRGGARGARVAPRRHAGAGRAAVPVQFAGRHRGAVPEGRGRGRGEPRPPDPVPARCAAPAARARLDDRRRDRPRACLSRRGHVAARRPARAERDGRRRLRGRALLPDAAAAADPAGRAGAATTTCRSRSASACRSCMAMSSS